MNPEGVPQLWAGLWNPSRVRPLWRHQGTSMETDSPSLDLLTVFESSIVAARQRLRAGMQVLREEFPCFPRDSDALERLLVEQLIPRLRKMADRTLTLEMHVARLQGQLTGATPAERFQSFVARLRQPEVARAILAEYPLLERQVSICLDQWVRFSLTFLRR